MERDSWGGQSIMVWGAIGINHKAGPFMFQNIGPGKGNGITALQYINQVLRLHIVAYSGRHQHDNARAHTARATRDFLQQQNIRIMPWPARSPELTPIEHLWVRNAKKSQRSATWALSIGRDSNGFQPPLYTPCSGDAEEREREMFYLTTHSTHFIYGYMASDIWLRTILIVRKETRCRHIGYSYRLTPRVLLYAPSHRLDSTYHGLCYTSRGALAGARNSSMGPPHEGSIRRPTAQ